MKAGIRSDGIFDVRDRGSTLADVGLQLRAVLLDVQANASGRIRIPGTIGNNPWTWVTPVTINFPTDGTTHSPAICEVFGEASWIQLALSSSASTALTITNNVGVTHIHDLVFTGNPGIGNDVAAITNIGAVRYLLMERVHVWGVQSSGNAVLYCGASALHVRNCRIVGCGTSGTAGTLHITALVAGLVESVTFQDFDQFGTVSYNKTPTASHIFLEEATRALTIRNCQFDEAANHFLWIHPPDANHEVTAVVVEGCSALASSSANSSILVDTFGCGSLTVRDTCVANFDQQVYPLADLTNVGVFRLERVTLGSVLGPAINLPCQVIFRAGCGSAQIVDVVGQLVIDTSNAAPANLSYTDNGVTTVDPTALTGLQVYYNAGQGVTLTVGAAVLGVGGTFVPVTPGHHLDISAYGGLLTINFTGSENTIGAFISAINAQIAASNVGGQIKIQGGSAGNASAYSIAATSSTDVLTSLGFTVGPFPILPRFSTWVDNSGKGLSRNVFTGSNVAYKLSSPEFNGQPIVQLRGTDVLSVGLTPTLHPPFTVFVVGRQAVAGSWLPSTPSGLSAWLEADTGVARTGANVTSWTDQSSHGFVLSATGSPQWSATGGTNSLPTITFNGTSNYLSNASTPGVQGSSGATSVCTVFILSKAAGPTSSACAVQVGDQESLDAYVGTDRADLVATVGYVDGGLSTTNWELRTLVLNGANQTFKLNGVTVATGSFTPTGINVLSVGNSVTNSTFFWPGSVSVVIAYNRTLTATEEGNLYFYLNAKWGLSIPGAIAPASATPFYAFDGGTANSAGIYSMGTAIHMNSGVDASFAVADPSKAQVYIAEFNGANSRLGISSDTLEFPLPAGTGSIAGVTIGNIGGGGSDAGWDIHAIGVLDHITSLQEKQQILQRFSHTCGIPLLPGTQPGTSIVGAGSVTVTDSGQTVTVGGTPIFRANHAGSPYTLTTSQLNVFVDVSGGPVTLNLPPAPPDGWPFTVNNTAGDASVNNITINRGGSDQLQDPNNPSGSPGNSVVFAIKGAAASWLYGATEVQWRLT